MASAGKESFKQDLVVSIRYRNELPPPPMPPKFLDIDTGGIQQYLTTSYASAIARREEPNIDVDAEGGMPIDMIGIPGYFLGDESAIMAPDVAPPLDPADAALMLSLEQLKSQNARSNVSFLRKNQYLSSAGTTRNDRVLGPSRVLKPSNKNPALAPDRNDKENIKKIIQRGFDTAYAGPTASQADHDLWLHPKHPTNPRARPISFHPVLPDLETGTDVGNWGRIKFEKPPLPPRNGRRDDRIDSALFMAMQNKKAEEEWTLRKKAYDANPKSYDDPGPIPPYTYVMTVPANAEHVPEIRKVLYDGSQTETGGASEIFEESEDTVPRIPFAKARVYTTVVQTQTAPQRFMALGLYDPNSKNNAIPPSSMKSKQGPAAYFYPIAENIRFKPDRSKLGDVRGGLGSQRAQQGDDQGELQIDRMMVASVDENAFQKAERAGFRGRCDGTFKEEYEELEKEGLRWREEQENAQLEQEELGEDDDGLERFEDSRNGGEVNGNGYRAADVSGDGEEQDDDGSPAAAPARRERDASDDAMDDD